MFLVFLNYFDVLMSKIIFKKLKNIINIYFNTKNYLKTNNNHTVKYVTVVKIRLRQSLLFGVLTMQIVQKRLAGFDLRTCFFFLCLESWLSFWKRCEEGLFGFKVVYFIDCKPENNWLVLLRELDCDFRCSLVTITY